MAEFTIAYLESLSNGELVELAAKYDLDIPDGLDRVFIIEELLYIDHEGEDAQPGHEDVRQAEYTETAVLPKQYHASFVEVLIRDPLWAFAFWEIKALDRDHFEGAEEFEGYCLRVTPVDGESLQPNAQASFIITVDMDDNGRYLGFPPDDGRCFKVELCMHNEGQYTVIAESPPFTLPPLAIPADQAGAPAQAAPPLALLSGIERFSLVHSEDRAIRPKGIL